MAARGRPPLPQHARFAVIPRGFDGCVYAAELGNGLVKVGFSANPRTRMTSLSKYARRVFGVSLQRFHVGANLPKRVAARAETNTLRRLNRIATPLAGTKEYFAGLRFGDAVNLVNQMTRAATPTPAEQGA